MNRQSILYSVAAGVGAIGASIGLCWLGRKLWQAWRSSHDDEWGDEEIMSMFMRFHYSPADEVMLYSFSPKGFLDFPKRLAEQCIKHMTEGVLSRALDVGCGPGGVSFELARGFSEVVGLDYSQGFIAKCQELKTTGQATYWLPVEGSLGEEKTACIDASIDRSRVQFIEGDACNLPELGQFGCVLAANLVTRIPEPMKFLSKMPDIIVPGGILVIASHYVWDEMSSPKEKWLGGCLKDGREVRSFDGLKHVLQTDFDLVEAVEVPFMTRESARMYYWGVDHTTIWRRKS